MITQKQIKQWGTALLVIVLFVAAFRFTGCDVGYFLSRSKHLTDLTSKMFPPDVSFAKNLAKPLLSTIQMAFAGTVLGAFLALITAPFCASNMKMDPVLRTILRVLIQILRSFPALIIALTATFLLGLGTFAGTCAITISTFAIITRLTYEDTEGTNTGAYNALINAGAGKITAFYRAVFPQIRQTYLVNTLYLMETNVRHSSIMGYVGAGGIGLLLNEKISWREYSRVGTILIALFIAVCFIETLSGYLVSVVNGSRKIGCKEKKTITAACFVIAAVCLLSAGSPDLKHTSAGIVKKMIMGLVRPDTAFMTDMGKGGLLYLLAQTVCISFAGTVIGAVPAIILSVLNTQKFMSKLPALFFRVVIMAIRSVPFMIYGLIFIRVTGSGAFAGVLTMAICSIGLLSKRFTEAMDTMDLRAYNALKSSGASKAAAAFRGVLPQLGPKIASAVLYRFDVNIREASILGLVGAGGIGAALIQAMNKYAWKTAGAIFIGIIVIVWIIDIVSGGLRRKLQ